MKSQLLFIIPKLVFVISGLLSWVAIVDTKARYKPMHDPTIDYLEEETPDRVGIKEWLKQSGAVNWYFVDINLVLYVFSVICCKLSPIEELYQATILAGCNLGLASVYTDTKYAVINDYATLGGIALAFVNQVVTLFYYANSEMFYDYLSPYITSWVIVVTFTLALLVLKARIGGGDIKYWLLITMLFYDKCYIIVATSILAMLCVYEAYYGLSLRLMKTKKDSKNNHRVVKLGTYFAIATYIGFIINTVALVNKGV